jgi:hypothetical protein
MSPSNTDAHSSTVSTKAARAVRAAMRSRNHQLEDDFGSIQVFLGLSGNSSRVGPPVPGSSTGQLLAQFYEKVAAEMRRIAKAVQSIDFDSRDKRQILAGLSETEKAFHARAQMVSTLDPSSITNALAMVESHERSAAKHNKTLEKYFGRAAS